MKAIFHTHIKNIFQAKYGYEMQNKNKIIITTIIILLCGCSHQIKSTENWIDYNNLSTINAGMSQNDLEGALG